MRRTPPVFFAALFVYGATASAQTAVSTADAHSYVGMSSCTAAACHGSAPDSNRPAWQSAYSVWRAKDPHHDAYRALFNERSREIVQALSGQPSISPDQYLSLLNERCIGCHATPVPASFNTTVALVDGVTCEACHGPAGNWLQQHTRLSWNSVSAEANHSQYGMIATTDLSQRAAACARCHVGPGAIEGHVYDMNHDLIAAGHPRLTFEFSAYLAHLPPHWDAARDRQWADKTRKTARTDFDAETWSVGQTAVLQATVNLIKLRADIAGKSQSVWPEFAEYDCYGCHHNVGGGNGGSSTRRGTPQWSTWSRPLVAVLARESGDEQAQQSLAALTAELERPLPRADVVSRLAADAGGALQSLQTRLSSKPLPKEKLLAALSQKANDLNNWDEAAQWYLAATALSGVYRSVDAPRAELRQGLDELRRHLEEPKSFELEHPDFRQTMKNLLQQLP